MTNHNSIFFEMINNRAQALYEGDPAIECMTYTDFQRWKAHWIATGKALQQELEAEGLHKSADSVGKIIAFVEK